MASSIVACRSPNAYELRQALEDRGVPVEMVVYKGFGHGITKPRRCAR